MAISLSTWLVSLWERNRGRHSNMIVDTGKKSRGPKFIALGMPHILQRIRKAASHTSQRNGWGQVVQSFTLHLYIFPNRTWLGHAVQVLLLGNVCLRLPQRSLSSTFPILYTVTLNQALILKLISSYQGSWGDFMQVYSSHRNFII